MEDTHESKTILKDRHNGSRLSSLEFMQCGHSSIKSIEKTPEYLDDYLP